MDYLVKIRSVQTPLNGQFSIGANTYIPEPHISRPIKHLYAMDNIRL